MKLSTPIYCLKRQARTLSRKEGIPLYEALDRVAVQEGFVEWSLLASQLSARLPARKLLSRLAPGDFVLLGARPGHGKTQLSLELIIEAMESGRHGVFFTLAYSTIEVLELFKHIGRNPADFKNNFELDASDSINAERIIKRLSTMPPKTIAVVDYLQLLDQKRENPDLKDQINQLKVFANENNLIIVFISQINRSFDLSNNKYPCLEDVRLPNPLDLMIFNKACFLSDGELKFTIPG